MPHWGSVKRQHIIKETKKFEKFYLGVMMATTARIVVVILMFLVLAILDLSFIRGVEAAERSTCGGDTPFGAFVVMFLFNLVGIVPIWIFVVDSQNRLSKKVIASAWTLAVGIIFIGTLYIGALSLASAFGCVE
jgi:hypothetical protein